MEKTEVHIELLLSKQVRDSDGKNAGRIEEVRAAKQGEEWVIIEYLLGAEALAERLSAQGVFQKIGGLMGRKDRKALTVPWDKMDLSNPEEPKLLVTKEELREASDDGR